MSILLVLSLAVANANTITVDNLDAHPRPDWARPCVLQNGAWAFDFDPDDAGVKERWFEHHAYGRTIQVPFPWQSELSGVAEPGYSGAAWYQRDITVPASAVGQRVFLVFGAVDWEAKVWVNGVEAAEHEGGYTPFEVELTGLVSPGQTARVVLRAYDVTDPEMLTGKQTGWYTQTGGIWQTVYLECRGTSFVRQAHVIPDIDAERAAFDCIVEAEAPGEYTVAADVRQGGRTYRAEQTAACVAGANRVTFALDLPEPALWSPDSPNLYDADITLSRGGEALDTVRTYFGMRKVSRGRYGEAEHEYILLNNKPIYLRGALHQSFNPEGVYTHPDDDYIRNDYVKAKELGLNFIRIHIKIDEPRALYWADKLGVLLMCDIPNYWKHGPRSHEVWEQTLRAAIARDFNHPSIFAWCDFNETWGIMDGGYGRDTQLWVRDMFRLTKTLDPTRLAEDNSPCRYDHVETDINSWHFYIDRYRNASKHIANVVEKTFPGSEFNYIEGWKQDTAPLINSEYGGVSAGSGDRDISWVFLFLTNLLRKYDKIGGYVYTELSDIEWEHNGFLNYDRSPKEYHYPAGIDLADLQGDEFPVLDCAPCQKVKAGSRVSIPILLSHWSERKGLKLRAFVDGKTVDGIAWDTVVKPMVRDVEDAAPYRVTPQGAYDIDVPNWSGLMNVVVEVLQDGQRCAANYCVLDVRDGAVWADPQQYAVSFPVNSFAAAAGNAPPAFSPDPAGKLWASGACFFEYRIRLPRGLKAKNIAGCRLVAEVGSKAVSERLDWPARKKAGDYPQTDAPAWPTDVTLSINGVPFETVTIENDFADARGVLSHMAHFHHGSNGKLVDVPITGAAFEALAEALKGDREVRVRFEVKGDAQNLGGLSLFGESMGAHPADPALVFALKPGVKKPKGGAELLNTFQERTKVLIERGPVGLAAGK